MKYLIKPNLGTSAIYYDASYLVTDDVVELYDNGRAYPEETQITIVSSIRMDDGMFDVYRDTIGHIAYAYLHDLEVTLTLVYDHSLNQYILFEYQLERSKESK